ncbi:MAG: tocopherol cyclase family protein [Eubacteriaceae bacterium]
MKNFQFIHKKRTFFEGWYFKNQTNDRSIAFIPGINIDALGNKQAFIQIITPSQSYLAEYDFSEFKAQPDAFSFQIGNSVFQKSGISVNINTPQIRIKGHLTYTSPTPLKYDIMGPFSIFPSMECNHGILSLNHHITGVLKVNGVTLNFDRGVGYIEKDWGRSFPKNYLWTQCNLFSDPNTSVMISIADIPFLGKTFKGCIAVVYYKNKEYRLATYKGVKILKCNHKGAIITQGSYRLEATFFDASPQPLFAPTQGEMSRTIRENIASKVNYTFYKKNTCLFNLTSDHASLETVFE